MGNNSIMQYSANYIAFIITFIVIYIREQSKADKINTSQTITDKRRKKYKDKRSNYQKTQQAIYFKSKLDSNQDRDIYACILYIIYILLYLHSLSIKCSFLNL